MDQTTLFFDHLVRLWRVEITNLDGHSVTFGGLTISLVVFAAGVIIAGSLKKIIHQRLLEKSQLNESARAIAEKLSYYFLLLLVLLFALRLLNVPLTAFTFLGGALAIGIGFGAQKLISNFISGFILMAEQPIKVGDLIEINGEPGWIDDIGVRATSVRTFSNINILVPNSYFIENNITNWTHNDNLIRCNIMVGVVYGAPVETVKEKLLQSAREHPAVHDDPPPVVWFSDFGDNSLVFKLLFWITISPTCGRQQTESDIRFRIDRLFREAGLVIAFPQRDVHLDTSQPLKLQFVNRHPAEDSDPT